MKKKGTNSIFFINLIPLPIGSPFIILPMVKFVRNVFITPLMPTNRDFMVVKNIVVSIKRNRPFL